MTSARDFGLNTFGIHAQARAWKTPPIGEAAWYFNVYQGRTIPKQFTGMLYPDASGVMPVCDSSAKLVYRWKVKFK